MITDTVLHRLNRVEGQIRALRRMYEEGRDCLEIAQQVVAARQALARVGKDLVSNEAVRCARSSGRSGEFDKLIKTLFDIS